MSELNLSEARAGLPALLDRVADGEEVTITRHGRPVAVMVRPDTLRARRAQASITQARELGEMIDNARERPLAPGSLTTERAEDLAEGVRRDRG